RTLGVLRPLVYALAGCHGVLHAVPEEYTPEHRERATQNPALHDRPPFLVLAGTRFGDRARPWAAALSWAPDAPHESREQSACQGGQGPSSEAERPLPFRLLSLFCRQGVEVAPGLLPSVWSPVP